nr:MAG TPA: tail protein [Caudoviricetes sp.]
MNQETKFVYDNGARSVTFESGADFWITELSGMSQNEVAISETQGAGQIGATMSNQSIKSRTVTVNGFLRGNVPENRRALLACILPGVMARLIIYQNGQHLYLEGAPSKTPEISAGEVLQEFQFAFRCPYPYWRTVKEMTAQIAGLTALFQFPFYTGGTWKLSQYSESFYTNVPNSGNVPVEIDVLFQAMSDVTNPELYHMGTGGYLKVNRVLLAGESFRISTVYGRKGATLIHADSTEENGFCFLDVGSDLNLVLQPGDNVVRYQADSNREGLRVTITAPEGVFSGV